ncbi:MAG: CheY chemotaxis protein or a CheY-like, partial [Phycisphaerales bacterium]|nr:CheY chemotaxis protein or a CheY-like [Phycisphaerales bacterium]
MRLARGSPEPPSRPHPGTMHPHDPTTSPPDYSPTAVRRYGVAVVLAVLVTLIRFALLPLVNGGDAPFLLFYAAVMAAGWYGGFRPGMLTTVLCAAVAASFFMTPATDPENETWQAARLGIFVLEGVV